MLPCVLPSISLTSSPSAYGTFLYAGCKAENGKRGKR